MLSPGERHVGAVSHFCPIEVDAHIIKFADGLPRDEDVVPRACRRVVVLGEGGKGGEVDGEGGAVAEAEVGEGGSEALAGNRRACR